MDHSGTQAGGDVLHNAGLVERPVHLYRDGWGIPHVRAQSAHDAFVGQGYAHAMDRLWQMDAGRKQMEGRWSEWVGEAGVAADRLARCLRAAAASVRDYAALGAEAKAMVDAYTAGVNAYLQTQPAPAEYGLLATAPEPWEGWHCIAAMRQRGYLMGSLWFKLWRAAALAVIGPDDVVKLRYDDDGADRLCIPPGADASRWIASLADLREQIRALNLLAASADIGGGSNNWALAPSRTATGRPILAGDPHRALELPGMYAQMHLGLRRVRCDRPDSSRRAGLPAFRAQSAGGLGRHTRVRRHSRPLRRTVRPRRSVAVSAPGRLAARRRRQPRTFKVRDGATVPVQIVETMHGSVVAGDPARGAALTLKSVQFFDLDRSFDCLLPMLRAGSVDSLFKAVRGWGLIDHNLVAADTGGHIGHLVRAVVPRRPAINGWLPVPGWTGEYEWDGVIPAEQMPRADDPARGYLVTANNRVVTTVPGTGDYFCTDALPPYRAKRIEELIAGLGPASPGDMAAIHHDDASAPARIFQAALADVAPASTAGRVVLDIVLGWDARMSPGSVGAACYSRLRWALARIVGRRSGLAAATTGRGGLMQLPGGVSDVSHLWWVLPALLRSDDLSLTGGSTWPELLAEALEEVAIEPPDIPWQRLHTAALTHPLTPLLPAAPAALSPAGAGVGGDNETVWATGCRAESGTAAVYGAVARYVFDVGNWDNSTWIVAGGASGDPASPHYVDQHEAWSRCELIPMQYSWDVITAADPQLTLEPDPTAPAAPDPA